MSGPYRTIFIVLICLLDALFSFSQDIEWEKKYSVIVNSADSVTYSTIDLCRELEAFSEKEYGLNHQKTALARMKTGEIYLGVGMYRDAAPPLAAAETFFRGKPEYRKEYADALHLLGTLNYAMGALDKAELNFRQQSMVLEDLYGLQSAELARCFNNLGGVYMQTKQHQKAYAVFFHAYNMQRSVLGNDDPEIATTLVNLAAYHDAEVQFGEAEKRLNEAIEIRSRQPDFKLYSSTVDNLINLYVSWHKETDAEKWLQAWKSVLEEKYGTSARETFVAYDKLAGLYLLTGRVELAESFEQKTLKFREDLLGENHDEVAANLYFLGKIQNLKGDFAAAKLNLRRAIDIYEFQGLDKQEMVCALLAELFMADYSSGDTGAAEGDLETLVTIKETIFGPNHPETLAVVEEIIVFYEKTGNLKKANAARKYLEDNQGR